MRNAGEAILKSKKEAFPLCNVPGMKLNVNGKSIYQ